MCVDDGADTELKLCLRHCILYWSRWQNHKQPEVNIDPIHDSTKCSEYTGNSKSKIKNGTKRSGNTWVYKMLGVWWNVYFLLFPAAKRDSLNPFIFALGASRRICFDLLGSSISRECSSWRRGVYSLGFCRGLAGKRANDKKWKRTLQSRMDTLLPLSLSKCIGFTKWLDFHGGCPFSCSQKRLSLPLTALCASCHICFGLIEFHRRCSSWSSGVLLFFVSSRHLML